MILKLITAPTLHVAPLQRQLVR